jgi:hypothetical protein
MRQTGSVPSPVRMIRYYLLLPGPQGEEPTLGRMLDDRSEACFDASTTPPTWQGCTNQIQRRLHAHDKIAEISQARAQAWKPAAFG